MIKGFISYFRIRKGIGFINAEDGASYFFHVSKFLDENAFQGSQVQFVPDAALDSDKAVDIMTLPVMRGGVGVIKFHNIRDRFGTLYAPGGECSFTQVTNDMRFSVGTPVQFAERLITMPDGGIKRTAYDVSPIPAACLVRGTVTAWDGVSGIFTPPKGSAGVPFDAESAFNADALAEGDQAEAIVINGAVRFLKATETSAIVATVRAVAINPHQGYALVNGPDIPQGIIGNPPKTLRKGDYVTGEFVPNARGYECLRHVVIPRDRIVYGTVSDEGTAVRLVNAPDYPPLPLPGEKLVGQSLPWSPRDGEICECLLAADGRIAIARQGHPFSAYAVLGPSEEVFLSSLTDTLHFEDRHVLAQAEAGRPPLWPHIFRVYERHRADTMLGAANRFASFGVMTSDGPMACEAFNLQVHNMNGKPIYAVFRIREGRPGRPNRHLIAFETPDDARFLSYAPVLPEAYITAEGIDF